MNEQEKQEYLENYHKAKEKGVPFFPDIIFKDAIVSLLVFLVLVGLAYFVGAPLEARANPADASYTPRPEWYFLFLFQLLKYFPGKLEVVGIVVVPGLLVLLLISLPFIERSNRRHFLQRPSVTGITALCVVGIGFLTIQSVREAPPPMETSQGDPVAELYRRNCSGCHGTSIDVPAGTNLHSVISQGTHEGMPGWSGDLTTDQIDALAGFILSPAGNTIFSQNCGECHQVADLVAGNPLEIKNAIEQGKQYPAHSQLEIPDWSSQITKEEETALLNFLLAPDGQRLFAINCSPCHGKSVSFSGEKSDLQQIISKGGMHLEMPPWQGRLDSNEIDLLAAYVVNPTGDTQGEQLFQQYCTNCHGQRVPKSQSLEQARQTIQEGGAHKTMPVWGDVLTSEQIDALVTYTLNSEKDSSQQEGQDLFAKNCSGCHGALGEGGPNPARQGDIIAPISSAEYLKTRDDLTLRTIISEGQPNFGMSPFGLSNGGPFDDEEIGALVSYIRSWEDNPPVELPPEVTVDTVSLDSSDLYAQVCAQCHGAEGEGGVGPALRDAKFQSTTDDEAIFKSIDQGHTDSPMIGWGSILSSEQIQGLVTYIRKLGEPELEKMAQGPSFAEDVLPILKKRCTACHGSDGGWKGTSYENVMTTGDHGPVVVAGDVDGSLLAQKILGTQSQGSAMPPMSELKDDQIQTILDWINAGAQDN